MLKEILCFTAIIGLCQSSAVDSSRLGSQTRYLHYSRSRPYTPQVLSLDQASIKDALIAGAPLVVIVHGHLGDAFTAIDLDLVYEILMVSPERNVVVVDWSGMASSGYDIASVAVPSVGQNLAQFLQITSLAGFPLEDTRLIGYDLGAHVCGFAGRQLGGRISSITGLSPHKNGWTEARGPLKAGDAAVVEIIHTNNVYGIDTPMGNMDFFINGGVTQPGCTNHQCHHRRALDIMTASISHEILGYSCSNIDEARSNLCRGRTLRVGSLEFKIGSGIYGAKTGNSFPFY